MSMPNYKIQCDSCDYSTGNMIAWGRFEYESEGRRFSVNRTIAWCTSCNGFQPVEYFNIDSDDEEWLLADVDRFEQEVLPSLWRYLLARINGRYKKVAHRSGRIRERIAELMLIARRKGDERCLSCGSRDLKPFDVAVKLQYDSTYRGIQRTGFLHPGCDGEIQLQGTQMRFMMSHKKVRVYSLAGQFLREEPVV